MENSFVTQHKFSFQDPAQRKNSSQAHANQTRKTISENIDKEVTPQKSIWQTINIFSKIKRFSKGIITFLCRIYNDICMHPISAKIKKTDSIVKEVIIHKCTNENYMNNIYIYISDKNK